MVMIRSVAIIPARGGSAGIPQKNLQLVGGVPLVARAVKAAREGGIDLVLVSTDDAEIETCALLAGADVVRRPSALAGPTSSSESALLHALDAIVSADQSVWIHAEKGRSFEPMSPRVVVMIQATSPFIRPSDLSGAVNRVAMRDADCVFSATVTHAFQWGLEDGSLIAIGHSADSRPMRQQLPPRWQETGAFYAMETGGFRQSGHRFFGRLAVQEVPWETSFEIDTPTDLQVCRMLTAMAEPSVGSIDVDAIITDFDGVHTDDRVSVDATGHEYVTVNRRDGLGVQRALTAGLKFLILSAERNAVVSARGEKLNVEVIQGTDDKRAVLERWLCDNGLEPRRVAYLGNDINDLAPMQAVGWPCVTADSDPAVRASARVVLRSCGGDGAVRELCDMAVATRLQTSSVSSRRSSETSKMTHDVNGSSLEWK